MMKPHLIDLDEVLAWAERQELTAAASSKPRKRLLVRVKGGYRVEHNNATVYVGTDGRTAVDTYNAIR